MRESNCIVAALTGFALLAACGGGAPEDLGGEDGGDAGPAGGDAGPAGPWADLRQRVADYMDLNNTPGAAYAVVEDGEVVVSETAGYRCIADPDSPVTATTFFRTMGLQRTMTAIAFLEAAAAGDVSLDEPIEDELGSLGLAPDCWANQVTLRHLLTMTSGYPSGLNFITFEAIDTELCTAAEDSLTIAERVAQLDGQTMGAPPGKWNMRNAYGHTVAAQYVQAVTGNWERVLRQRLFEPAGLDRIHLRLGDDFPAGYACGHQVRGVAVSNFGPNQLCEATYPRSTGFIDLTELTRLAQILANGGLRPDGSRALSESTVDALFESDIPSWVSADAKRSHAFVLWETEEVGTVAVTQGGAWGYAVGMLVVPEERFAVVVLTNAVYRGTDRPDRGLPGTILYSALEDGLGVRIPPLWSPEPPVPAPYAWDPTDSELRELTGDYESKPGHGASLWWEADPGCLHGTAEAASIEEGAPMVQLEPVLRDRFQLSSGALGDFEGRVQARLWRDASGAPEGIYVRGAGHPYWLEPPVASCE